MSLVVPSGVADTCGELISLLPQPDEWELDALKRQNGTVVRPISSGIWPLGSPSDVIRSALLWLVAASVRSASEVRGWSFSALMMKCSRTRTGF